MNDPKGALQAHLARLSSTRITDLINGDAARSERFRCEAAGIHFDFSKHLLDNTAYSALLALAAHHRLSEAFKRLIEGETLNLTERRPALHTLLRGTGKDASPERWAGVAATLARMQTTVAAIHNADHSGHRGERLTDVVNLGIGGSDLGPRMICEALRNADDPMRSHFVANVDPQDLNDVIADLDPHTTLFVVCSKSFNTEETLSNATRARNWLLGHGIAEKDLHRHVLAVTTNIEAAVDFGIDQDQCYPIWDWVGGRFSLWSAIGLVIALQGGWQRFQGLLDGARAMDSHTATQQPDSNLPMTQALLEWWHCQLGSCANHLVLPYSQRLAQLPSFLQQLTMESNGKRITTSGAVLNMPSAPMLWGSAGTIGQHSYYQLLHQGNREFTADIILPLTNGEVDKDAHRRLAANALAQSRALLTGRDHESAAALARTKCLPAEAAAHLELPGNHSHSLVWFDEVSPERLGALLAAYEHKTFFLSQLMAINAFDQWGVELGKVVGQQILAMLESGNGLDDLDPATADIIRLWREANSN